MMRKFQATGVILIDCWADSNQLSLPKNKEFYTRIKQFLVNRINYQYIVSTIDDLDPILNNLPGQYINTYCWEDLQELGLTHGNWIIAGQAWQVCFHNCKLGINAFIEKNYPTLNLFSNPTIVDTDQDFKLTKRNFEIDSVNWGYQAPIDLWAVNVPGRSTIQILI